MLDILEKVNSIVWGIPTLLLILSIGFWLSIRTNFAQFRLFLKAIKLFFSKLFNDKSSPDDVSPMQALCTALAATVGTGNLAGVAGAIAIGGPGSVFWMWVCSLLGMIIKFAEATLSVRYRIKNADGETVGGPMYMIRNGMGEKYHWLASLYCFFGVVAAFGVGNATQINTLISSVNGVLETFGGGATWFGNLLMGIGLAVLVALMLSGGEKRIGTTAEKLVPFASALYLLMGLFILITRCHMLPAAFQTIIAGAFAPGAVTGGIVGSALRTIRIGTSRGIFTNEAGMGTAGIAHSAAKVSHPVEQGLMGIVEVFLDTIVICTMTALVILCSGIPIPYGSDAGIQLTNQAFSAVVGSWVHIPIALCVCCFAFATVLGWGLYGARCAQYLLGTNVWKPFVLLQTVTVIIGAVLGTGTIWMLADTVNALMVIPNLIALFLLTPELASLTKDYKLPY